MKTVLIHAYECAPYNRPGSVMGAQRPYQFAKHLGKFQWTAIVLCSDFKTRYTLDPATGWKAVVEKLVIEKLNVWDHSQSLVIELPSLTYADFIDRIWLRSVSFNKINGTFEGKPGRLNLLRRKLSTFLKLFRGDHSQSWQKVALHASSVILKNQKIDVQIAEHGPDAGLFVANEVHKQAGIRWIADFRDPVLQPVKNALRPIVKIFLRRMLTSSSLLINVTKTWSRFDERDFHKRSFCINNGFDPGEYEKNDIASPQVFKLAAYGNISNKGNLEMLFEGLAKWSGQCPDLLWEFHYFGDMQSEYQRLARQFKLERNFRIYPGTGRKELFGLLSVMDVLFLVSLDPSKNSDIYLSNGYLPGKVFEMFGLMKPFVVIPGDGGELDEIAQKSGLGFIAINVDEVVLRLKSLSAQKNDSSGILRPPNIEYIHSFTRENQAMRLAGYLNEVGQ